MSFAGLTACLLYLANAQATDIQPRVTISVYAVRATYENRGAKYIDPALEPIRKAIENLDFDTFRALKITQNSGALNVERETVVDPRYTVIVNPVAIEDDGRIRVKSRIEMPPRNPGEKNRVALETVQIMKAGQLLSLGGLPLDGGELVVVLSVKRA